MILYGSGVDWLAIKLPELHLECKQSMRKGIEKKENKRKRKKNNQNMIFSRKIIYYYYFWVETIIYKLVFLIRLN